MLLNNYPDTVALLQIHVWDAYATTWGNARRVFYGVTGTPTCWFDGWNSMVGTYTNVTQQYNAYRSMYLACLALPTDVKFRVGAEEVGTNQYEVSVEVAVEAGGVAKDDMRIYIAQVLDHWPASPTYSRNGFKQCSPYFTVSLQPGDSTVVQHTLTLDAASAGDLNNVKIICWAQVKATSAPAAVHNAVQMQHPFDPPYFLCPGDFNWDGQRDYIDYTIFSNAWNSVQGDPNYDPRCDINDDGNVDYIDYTIFSNGWGIACP